MVFEMQNGVGILEAIDESSQDADVRRPADGVDETLPAFGLAKLPLEAALAIHCLAVHLESFAGEEICVDRLDFAALEAATQLAAGLGVDAGQSEILVA